MRTLLNNKNRNVILWLFIYLYLNKWKEGNVLFNDALKTFYFTVIWRWTQQVCHKVHITTVGYVVQFMINIVL